jgi:hypothetical protein
MERQRPHNLSCPLWDGPGGTRLLLGILSLCTAQNSIVSRVTCRLEEYTFQVRMSHTHTHTHTVCYMYSHNIPSIREAAFLTTSFFWIPYSSLSISPGQCRGEVSFLATCVPQTVRTCVWERVGKGMCAPVPETRTWRSPQVSSIVIQ